MQMRQRDVAALDAKYTKELADAKAENDALRDDVAAGVVGCIKAICPSVHGRTASAWIMLAASPDWQTPLNGLFHPQREADHCKKQLEGTKYINEQCDRVARHRWTTHAIIVSNTHASSPGV